MNFLEKDLEEIIFNTDNEILYSKGLRIFGKKYRQLKIGNYGIADIVTFGRETFYLGEDEIKCINVNVFELKKDKAGISAFLQALKYCKGIKRYFKHRDKNIPLKFNITLVSKFIDTKSDYIYLEDFLTDNYYFDGLSLNNYSFTYDFDGIKFKKEFDYQLVNEGF
jgi:hypothetical protein